MAYHIFGIFFLHQLLYDLMGKNLQSFSFIFWKKQVEGSKLLDRKVKFQRPEFFNSEKTSFWKSVLNFYKTYTIRVYFAKYFHVWNTFCSQENKKWRISILTFIHFIINKVYKNMHRTMIYTCIYAFSSFIFLRVYFLTQVLSSNYIETKIHVACMYPCIVL